MNRMNLAKEFIKFMINLPSTFIYTHHKINIMYHYYKHKYHMELDVFCLFHKGKKTFFISLKLTQLTFFNDFIMILYI